VGAGVYRDMLVHRSHNPTFPARTRALRKIDFTEKYWGFFVYNGTYSGIRSDSLQSREVARERNYQGVGVRNRRVTRTFAGAIAAAGVLLVTPSFAAAEVKPFGHTCKAENGVRFCPTVALTERVPT
jgi:hypothetical protein